MCVYVYKYLIINNKYLMCKYLGICSEEHVESDNPGKVAIGLLSHMINHNYLNKADLFLSLQM